MGHLSSKDLYKKLGNKIDGLTIRAPYNDALYNILKYLYSLEEAELIVKMPYGLSRLERIAASTKTNKDKTNRRLNQLCSKGLVIDLVIKGVRYYMPSPFVIGIFEFSMMRAGADVDMKTLAHLFHEYMSSSDHFFAANLKRGERIGLARTLAHEGLLEEESFVEVLDYEKASEIIETSNKFSLGVCSCRHEKMHLGEKKCDAPLESCTSFGGAADYLIRNNLAKEISKEEMKDLLERSREKGLVLNADNVKKNVSFMCHCCGCCCHMLQGISRFGYANTVVTSTQLPYINAEKCNKCGKCALSCPIKAIAFEKHKTPIIDETYCLGCGVCGLRCSQEAIKLKTRKQKPLYPETTFERVILQSLERGTLQNQLFDDVNKITHKFMRGFLGAFLKLSPVKRALLSDMLRSRFLASIKTGARLKGRGESIDL
ncbi:MAG: 4Fe-4S dicluster domain-containing protein [bacterium]